MKELGISLSEGELLVLASEDVLEDMSKCITDLLMFNKDLGNQVSSATMKVDGQAQHVTIKFKLVK